MTIRLLALLLVVTVPVVCAQSSTSGLAFPALEAGDLAPDLTSAKVLNAPNGTALPQSNIFGRLTVLAFFPATSGNPQSATRWNGRVDEFSGKPVQFVWMTEEKESSLVPWLADHPLKGFVLQDTDGATKKAYGIELPVSVIIGSDGRIIGYDRELVPSANMLNAALEGRIRITSVKQAEIYEFIESGKALLEAQPPRRHDAAEYKPNSPPSYVLHIDPSQSEGNRNVGSDDFWTLEGFNLEEAISTVYDLNLSRIELPSSLDLGKRYDFSIVLPTPEDHEQIKNRFQQGIQDYFQITATAEMRFIDVYVVTTTGRGVLAPKAPSSLVGSFGWNASFERSGKPGDDPIAEIRRPHSLSEIKDISGGGTATLDLFCNMLEKLLDRPVVNETNVTGAFTFNFRTDPKTKDDFLTQLRQQVGLVITPEQRKIEILVLKPR